MNETQEILNGKWSYLNSYLGKPVSINWASRSVEGTLENVDPTVMTATIRPTLLYAPNGKPYLEEKEPTTISLNLFDMGRTECVFYPIKNLEERVLAIQEANKVKSVMGFRA